VSSGLPWRMACSKGVGSRVQLSRVGRCRRFCGEVVCELLALVADGVELGLERRQARVEARGVEVAVLERVEVAVDRLLGALDLGGDGRAAVFERVSLGLHSRDTKAAERAYRKAAGLGVANGLIRSAISDSVEATSRTIQSEAALQSNGSRGSGQASLVVVPVIGV
jgi:hypothetical protein